MKSLCSLGKLKISKAEYGKNDKETLKATAFDPRSTELNPVSLMDELKVGLQEHASSAVILQILPQLPVEVNFYMICHQKESTLKDRLGYCPLPTERQPIHTVQFAWGHEKEVSTVDLYCKKN